MRHIFGQSNKTGLAGWRLWFLVAAFGAVCMGFVARLLYLQVVDTEEYESKAVANNYKSAVIPASRGEIYDRNGKKLVTNVISYNIDINRTTLENGGSVEILSKLIDLLAKHDVEIPDTCPLTLTAPYALDGDYIFDADKKRLFERFLKNNDKDASELTGTDFYAYLVKRFGIDEDLAQTPKGRKIAAIRYDMENADFSTLTPYTLLRNVDETLKTVISEHSYELHGIELSRSYARKYDENAVLCHILGSTGPIYAEEAEEYIKEKGYPYNATIGKDGIEKAFEDYLRPIDGTALCEIDGENNLVGYEITKEPKEGYSVRLTVDADLQALVEESLKKQIALAVEYAIKSGKPYSGEDCHAGAAVVLDVNSAEILALASAPGYDLNTYSADFNTLKDDPTSPLINRATQGIYPPGSTFKMLTAAAALDSGTIDINTYVRDEGEYKKYAPTYTPRCWIYLKHGTTHGYVNVADAIKVSCNYFFYTVADKMGVDEIVRYAKDFGLGVKTGIEVSEKEGILASPEYKESHGYVWNPGDTLQMAIGQSDNAFTPLQLASYMSTIVNGGNRYKTTLLKSVDEFGTGKPIHENAPVLLNKTHLSDQTVGIIKSAMRSVVDDEGGTARSVFGSKPYARDIGGKTGTAQVSKGSDTVLFVGFAPYENPQIAVAVVIENGNSSTRASSVAADIFDYYFAGLNQTQTPNNPPA